ncbi:7496_t:CDS:10 [Ambispora gerdemannii]|uniref:7496_t:CDS:1 n=1 Tax=Ambispora gerdemannii TaxID=144530 RepID=A0A9N9FZB8_9GLOM|nr:7496_t:CDS:10 [Ambispora gerdemannii]
MSGPSSMATLATPNSALFPHNIYTKEYHPSSSSSIQQMANNDLHRTLNGALSMSSPPLHSSMIEGNRKSPTHELDMNESLNLLSFDMSADLPSKLQMAQNQHKSPSIPSEVDVLAVAPPNHAAQSQQQHQPRLPNVSRSVPTSRRNSNETPEKPAWPEIERLAVHDKDDEPHDNNNTEKAAKRISSGHPQSLLQAALTRNMMDDTNNVAASTGAPSAINNTTDGSLFPQFNEKFLYEDDGESSGNGNLGPSYVHRYLQMNTDNDKFPILVRRDSFPGMLSASSAALDLAPLAQTSPRHARGWEASRNTDWAQYKPHNEAAERHSATRSHLDQMTTFFSEQATAATATTPTPSITSSTSNKKQLTDLISPESAYSSSSSSSNDRKKLDTLITENISKRPLQKLSNSFSTPDLQNGECRLVRRDRTLSDIEAESRLVQAMHLQNANDYALVSVVSGVCRFYQQGFCSRGERCQYAHTHHHSLLNRDAGSLSSVGLPQMGFPGVMPQLNNAAAAALYGQYGMNGLNNLGMFPGSTNFGYNQNLASINAALGNHRGILPQNNNALSKINQKRMNSDLEVNRFSGVQLEDLIGEIYSLCKDQHGCRYLQKKLEEKNEKYINMIFHEVFSHFVELMTDPFGNYLCQKLLEYCNDDQRTVIVETVAPELVNISLNMHGTRAVQKMIEFLSTSQQMRRTGRQAIRMVIVALNPNVVTLIKDLNGNHVIQKCLNRLSSEDNQFIYNAVSKHCVEVATHRHGCCVLQRCIDHASDSQKFQLVTEITYNALTLVQDPFGNYVVQYVLDLGDIRFTDALIRRFIGNVCLLSVQKFSSNVMEKCIRVAEPETRKYLIEEMLNKSRLDKLLRDSYANYVVQTSLDYADPIQRAQLVECIRPLLHAIRNTPYGKRIQGKLHREQQLQAMNSINNLNMNNLSMLGYPFNGLSNFSNLNSIGMLGLNEYAAPAYPYL